MKKSFGLLILFFIGLNLFGCVNEENMKIDEINIYTLNDFHGAIHENGEEVGISKLGQYLIDQKAKNPVSTLIISAGDMFQGTAVSSMSRGKLVVEAMNEIGFDAMTVGNHEFDWGIDGIKRFIDGNVDNGETSFPLLGANITNKSTNEIVDWIKPYTVLNRGNLKIGIIGTLGEDLTYDILASIVKDIEFSNQLETIKKYTKILRTVEACDIVIVSSHYDTKSINEALADLTGDYQVDAIINGHTHRLEYGVEIGDDNIPFPYVQSQDLGEYIGKITLVIDPATKKVTDAYSDSIKSSEVAIKESTKINRIITNYQDLIDTSNELLAKAGQYISREIGTKWAANAIRKYNNADVGFVNNGGIRRDAFPIYKDEDVIYGDIFRMMPFENKIVTFKLTGANLLSLLTPESGLTYSNTYIPSNFIINSKELKSNEYYTCVTMDFVFESNSIFKTAIEVNYSDYLFRDQLVNEVKMSAQNNEGVWILN